MESQGADHEGGKEIIKTSVGERKEGALGIITVLPGAKQIHGGSASQKDW